MSNVSILDLPRSQQILNNDLFIIQTENGTQTITFEDLNAVQLDSNRDVYLPGKLDVTNTAIISGDTYLKTVSAERFQTNVMVASSYAGPSNVVTLKGRVRLSENSQDTALLFGVNNTYDTNLYRLAVGTLRTDNTFNVGTNLSVDGSVYIGSGTEDTLIARSGSIQLPNMTDAAQCLVFGNVLNLNTTNVFLSANQTLRTDNNLAVGNNLEVYGDINAMRTSLFENMSAKTIRISGGTVLTNFLSAGLADLRTLKSVTNDNRLFSIYDNNDKKNFEINVSDNQVHLYVHNLTGGATGNPASSDDEFYKVQTTQYGVRNVRPRDPFIGQMYYDTSVNSPIWWNGSQWLKVQQFVAADDTYAGITSLRPTSPQTGQTFYDTTIGKPVWWTGSTWTTW